MPTLTCTGPPTAQTMYQLLSSFAAMLVQLAQFIFNQPLIKIPIPRPRPVLHTWAQFQAEVLQLRQLPSLFPHSALKDSWAFKIAKTITMLFWAGT